MVTIADVNDHSPTFAEEEYTFDMTTREQGAVITQVVARDSDPDSVITYTFLGNVM